MFKELILKLLDCILPSCLEFRGKEIFDDKWLVYSKYFIMYEGKMLVLNATDFLLFFLVFIEQLILILLPYFFDGFEV